MSSENPYASLVSMSPDVNTVTWPIYDSVKIGRMGQFVDIVIDDPLISRTHVRIFLKESRYIIKDVSTNGTWINDRKIPEETEIVLRDEDVLSFGDKGLNQFRFYDSHATKMRKKRLERDEDQVFLIDRRPMPLTPKEYILMDILFEARGGMVSLQECAVAVWDDDDVATRKGNIHQLVAGIRKKFREYAKDSCEGIELARNREGYFLNPDLL